jgi:hypothetical protein
LAANFFFLALDGPATSDVTEDCDDSLPASSSSSWKHGPRGRGCPNAMLKRRNRSSWAVSYNMEEEIERKFSPNAAG